MPATWSIAGQRDFNGDGNADLLWRDTSGNTAIWDMNGTAVLNANTTFVGNVPTTWQIVGTGDFNGDGFGDILWRDTWATRPLWLMKGTTVLNQTSSRRQAAGELGLARRRGLQPRRHTDILWRDTSGNSVAIWHMNGTTSVAVGEPRRRQRDQLVDQAEPATSTTRAGATFSGGTAIRARL